MQSIYAKAKNNDMSPLSILHPGHQQGPRINMRLFLLLRLPFARRFFVITSCIHPDKSHRYNPLKTPRNVNSQKQNNPVFPIAVSGSHISRRSVVLNKKKANLVNGVKVDRGPKRLVLGRVARCAWRVRQVV